MLRQSLFLDWYSMLINATFAWLYWNPPREAFTIPFIDRPIMWYGICFVTGFVLGYFILLPILRTYLLNSRPSAGASNPPSDSEVTAAKQLSVKLADRLTWLIVLGTVVGARLGHVLFYDWAYYQQHPGDIVKVWEGGLASHGGTLGVIASLFLFLRWNRRLVPSLSFVSLIDMLVIPTALTACCIRIGNFINQEILGSETRLPWGVIFGHPADGSSSVPRHPVQLYEAAAYLATFVLLYVLWRRKGDSLKPGVLSGLFFILVFGGRFLIEFLKVPQGAIIDESFLQMGQYLSIPFICFGVALLVLPKRYLGAKD